MLNKDGERALATIRTIDEIHPITFLNDKQELEEASTIERVVIGGWNMVVQKNRFEVGQLCVYVEYDTILPKDIELFSFLDGKRIRTKKLKGVVSQGVVFQIPEILDVIEVRAQELAKDIQNSNTQKLVDQWMTSEWQEGEDVTELIGAIKYDEYSAKNGGDNSACKSLPSDAVGKFPDFIPKTDEERVQNLGKELKFEWGAKEVVEREKLHGSSITIYARVAPSSIEGLPNSIHYGICSRNLELKLDSDTTYVKVGIPKLIKLVELCNFTGKSVAIQGELIGPGINGNPYKLDKHEIYFFTAYDINDKRRYSDDELRGLIEFNLKEKICPLVGKYELINDMNFILAKVNGKSALNENTRREGSVIRAVDGSFSFKAVSNDWSLHEK